MFSPHLMYHNFTAFIYVICSWSTCKII